MKKIAIITTMWSSINNWIKPFLNLYWEHGIDVTLICNMDAAFEEELHREYPFVHTYPIPFPRGMKLLRSLKSITALKRYLKKERFDLVQYSTPNASLYASVASYLAKVPVRLYCQWGMVFVTMHGIKRALFQQIERFVCRLSTNVQPDSFGNLEFCREHGFYTSEKSCVIWNGSAKGVDLIQYDISKKAEYRRAIRDRYHLSETDTVIGFVGRLGREKGCNELFRAFRELQDRYPGIKLLFVGPIEKEDTIEPSLLSYFQSCDDIIKTDRVPHVEQYVSAMDLFVLPSYREGFGMSVVEASAMGVPVITTEYPGPSGGMIDGVTGITIPIGDADAIVTACVRLLEDREAAARMGQNGRRFAEERFDRRTFAEKYIRNRLELLGERSSPPE